MLPYKVGGYYHTRKFYALHVCNIKRSADIFLSTYKVKTKHFMILQNTSCTLTTFHINC